MSTRLQPSWLHSTARSSRWVPIRPPCRLVSRSTRLSKGNGEWLNTSTYIFYADPALEGGKTYSVNVNPDLKSTDGSPLQETTSWSFSTAMPKLLSIEPSTETPWPLNPEIKLTFNQPMDQASVEANFSLIGPEGAVPGKISWDEDLTILTFTPDSLLPRNTSYMLTLDGQAQARGGSQLGESLSAEVITVPNLSVTNTEPAQGGSMDVNTGVTLLFQRAAAQPGPVEILLHRAGSL